jgi:hypothetical protein
LGDDCGYFIYEFDTERPAAGIEILAKAASFEATERAFWRRYRLRHKWLETFDGKIVWEGFGARL